VRVWKVLKVLVRRDLVSMPRRPVSFMAWVRAEAVICVYSVRREGIPRPASVLGRCSALVGKDMGRLLHSLTVLSTALSIMWMSVREKGATIIGYLMAALMHCVIMRMYCSGVALLLALLSICRPLVWIMSRVACSWVFQLRVREMWTPKYL